MKTAEHPVFLTQKDIEELLELLELQQEGARDNNDTEAITYYDELERKLRKGIRK